jgi:L-malate glycosyltransferase
MNICIIGATSLSPQKKNLSVRGIGGVEGYISDQIGFLSCKNIQVDFVGKIFNYYPLNNLRYFEIQKKVSSTHRFLINLMIKTQTMKIKTKTIIHAHRPDHLFCVSLFKKNPCILTIHGQQAITVKSRKGVLTGLIYSFMEYFALRKAKYLIVTDQITKKYYIKNYPRLKNKIRIIPTGIDLSKFRPYKKGLVRNKYGIGLDTKCLLYLGRIEPPKRVADIIKAFALSKNTSKNSVLLIVGDGREKKYIEKLVQDMNLSDSVIFMGAKHRNELPEIISIADAAVLYSHNEGSPLSIKECIACGVPVIANIVGDVAAVIDDGQTGYVLHKENNYELSQLILKCFDNADGMKQNCIQKAQKFSHINCFNQVKNIYDQVLK